MSKEKREQVIALGRLGWSLRRIELATGVRRETAGDYLRSAGVALRTPGGWGRRPPAKPALDASQVEVKLASVDAAGPDQTRLLRAFIDLNNQVLDRFTPVERERIGVHVCPGSDFDSPHSADVDYSALLPDLFQMHAGRFYLQMASEADKPKVLQTVKNVLRPNQLVFIGVIDTINSAVETVELVRDRVLQAASILPVEQLGTTDDCGFSPFADDTSTARDTAFNKIRARIEGTALAAEELGLASVQA